MARPARRPGNLPAEATSFIGRRRELAELREKLAAARLVSLVGPGGVGKTRLAIRMGSDLGRGFPDGAWLVELAEVQDPGLVGNAVLGALDLRDQAAAGPLAVLLSYLRDKQLLLVVDNCERVLAAAAQLVTEVINAAPGVRVLVTSREPLSVSGEHVLPVPPLDLPLPDAAEPLDRLRQNEAVMLFTQRAAAASGTFELTAANQGAVVELCRRLDGLPLAIELAAVRTRVLTVEQVRDRLSDRFGLLTGGSRASAPSSDAAHHHRLEPRPVGDRRADAPAVGCVGFAGRFTLEDVESVCTFDDVPAAQVLDLLSALVDKSLVMKEDVRAVACYRLHETMREYARVKLRQAGEEEDIERCCAEYYGARCGRSAVDARYRLSEWLEWMDLEIDNVRSVLRGCLDRADYGRGVTLATSLVFYWITRATSEGARWLDELLAPGEGSPAALAWGYFMRGFLAVLQADPVAARSALKRSVAAVREVGQHSLLAHSLAMASIGENMVGGREGARRLLDEAQAAAAALGDDLPAALMLLQAEALNGFFEGNLEAVRVAASEGVRLSRQVGDVYALEMALMNVGLAALIGGDRDGAGAPLAEAVRIAHRIDDRVAQFMLLGALGYRAAASGEARLAARLLGAAETIRTGAGLSVNGILAPLLARAEESAAAALGGSRFGAELMVGKRLSRDASAALALGERAQAANTEMEHSGAGLLGKREAEVARLVADGLSNKQIGARLFLSERTVESHVRNILNKLGCNTRAQIAAWVASMS